MSPEICQAETYNMRSDIWSLGCIMFELCTKEPPFNAKTHIQLAQNIRKGVFKDLPSMYSKELQNVIASCLKVNPRFRPDAASLLTVPYVWIARKGLEMVETGKILKSREEVAVQKLKQAEDRLASLDRERETIRQQTEDTLRREWEVKARLEIDHQIELGLERLQKKFDKEVKEKAQEIARTMPRTAEQRALRNIENPPPPTDKENIAPHSSISASGEEDFPSTTDLTDLSALSLESPNTSTNKPRAPRKSSKTPFSRSKTTLDSPADVQMGEPSPMSISSLALSPRRNAVAQAAATASSKNIFTEAARQKATDKWEPTLAYNSDEDDDEIPELPSPTRPKLHARDPFKMPARPGLTRQATTATMQKLTTQPTLFPTTSNTGPAAKAATGSGIPRTVTEPDMRPSALARSPSNRRLSKLPSSNNLAGDGGSPTRKAPSQLPSKIGALPGKQAKEGGEEMMKAVMARNMNVGTGRTLVELAQARAGGRPLSMDMGKGVKIAAERMERELPPVPVWDPERDEMPSPFLSRTRRI
jgi:NIMA (never in mitosis gene a)-related kinase 2